MRDAVVTVFGGTGFLGRHVVGRLAAAGATLRVPTREPSRAVALRPMGAVGQIVLERLTSTDEAAIDGLVKGASHVVSLIGILHERRAGDFMRVHAELAGRIAARAAAQGVHRLVHVSALGASPDSASLYARSKAAGEQAVRAAMPAAAILRPSIIVGPQDGFFNRFAAMARFSPALPLIGGGRTRFQPVYVGDVAAAVLAAATGDEAKGRTFELGGPRAYSFRELMVYMLQVLHRRRALVEIPWAAANWQARLLELLPEPLLTRDQVALLRQDNVVGADAAGLGELGLTPTPIEAVVPGYLRAYAAPTLGMPAA